MSNEFDAGVAVYVAACVDVAGFHLTVKRVQFFGGFRVGWNVT